MDEDAHGSIPSFDQRDDLFRGRLHVRSGDEGQSRFLQDSSCPRSTFVPSSRTTIGILSPISRAALTMPPATMSQRTMPPKMLIRAALTSLSETRILKALVTACFGDAAADVQEVGRRAARVLDDVHGGHGQPGAVDHAADVAVELDVVEVRLRRLDLEGRFFAQVPHGVDIGVAGEGVVVEVHLGVQGQDRALAGHDERVDLRQRGVRGLEGPIEGGDELDGLLMGLAFEPELEGQPSRLEAERARSVGSTYSLKMSSGFSAATFSISTPPSVEAMITAASRARSMTIPT